MTAALLALAVSAASPASDRVYVPPLRQSEGVDAAAVSVIETAILTAARRREPRVVGGADLAALIDLESSRQAAGCDTSGCDAELADALGAKFLLSAQLSKLGQTWVLSLVYMRREGLVVLGRDQLQKAGPAADVLLGDVPRLVESVLPAAPPPPAVGPSGLRITGAVGGGLGAATILVGGVMLTIGALQFGNAQQALAANDPATASRLRSENEWLTVAGGPVLLSGAVVAAIGGGLVAVDALTGAP